MSEVYTPGGRHSFIRDLAALAGSGPERFDAEKRLNANNEARAADVAMAHDVATRALALHGIQAVKGPSQERALSAVTATGGMEFVPPDWLLKSWASVSRAVSPLRRLATRIDLPPETLELKTPKLDSSAGVVPMSLENINVSEGFGETSSLTATVATFAGGVMLSQQEYDRSPNFSDEVIVREFSEAYAESLQAQLIEGTGTNGQLLGLLNVPGTNTITFTSASPTPAAMVEASAKAAAAVSKTRKRMASCYLMRGGRWCWISGTENSGEPVERPGTGTMPTDTDAGPFGPLAPGLPVFIDDASSLENITATGRDTILAVRASDIILLEDPAGPKLMANVDQVGTELRVVLTWHTYTAAFTNRYPQSIATVQGSGMAIPAGF